MPVDPSSMSPGAPDPGAIAAAVKEAFDAASDLPPARRAAYLYEHLGNDTAMRTAVEKLLAAHDQAGRFLAGPTGELHADDPPPNQSIGHYKLLQRIGEGGFGTVYMAAQEQPVRRRVALKIIKLGMDTRAVIARFEAERQALAMMDHPNIAKVFDAGATDTGRPYFVMELVNGVPLTEYCNANRLDTPQRLALFVQVCHAVQHAHQKGIIHRDLKPSNVLVTLHDDKAVPKVIDFGIAKATNQQLTEKTIFTEFRQMIGTPQYMSPEQAQMSGLDIDTRSDVFSLGVLLYELLTGTTPISARELSVAAYEQMQRMIREFEPPAPSTRLSTMGAQLAAVAADRHTDPKKLRQLVSGELDWIVMKALEKDRTRRYDTASGMARDIERYLADDTVEACPPSAVYRLRKFARRYRTALRVAACFAIILVSATVFSAWQAVRATRAKSEALAQTRRADEQTTIADGINRFFTEEVFGLADPNRVDRAGITLAEALDVAATKIDVRFPDDPKLRAVIRERFGEIFLELDRPAQAVEQLRKAVELWMNVAGAKAPLTLRSQNNLGLALFKLTHFKEARELLESTLADQTLVLGGSHPDTLQTASHLAVVLMQIRGALGKTPSEKPDDEKDLEVPRNAYRQALATLGPRHPATLDAESAMSWSIRWRGNSAEALGYAREASVGLRAARGEQDLNTMWASYNYAACLMDTGQANEAVKIIQPVVVARYRILGPGHLDTLISARRLAAALQLAGRSEESLAVLEQTRAHLADILNARSWQRGVYLLDIAKCYQTVRRYDRAAEFITAACQVADMPLDQDALLDGYARWLNDVAGAVLAFPAPALLDQSRAVALARKSCELSGYRTGAFVSTLRDALLNNGKSTEADAVLAKGEACCREVIGRQPGDALPLMDLGDLLKLQRRLPEALTAYTQATQLKPDMPQAWAALGECHRLADNLAKMAEDYSQAIALNPNRQWYWHERGYAYMRLGDQRRALPDHTKAIELGDGDAGERVRRAVAYEGLGEFANAEADYARAIEINRASDEVWRAQYEFYQRRGQADRALPALAKAIALVAASPEAQNNLAWALATDSNPAVRDLKTAIAIATKACQSSNYHTAGFINTLVVALTKQVDGFRHQNNDMGGLRQACLAAAEACHEAAPYYEKLTKSRARHEEPWLFAGSCERLSQLLRDMDEPKAAERGYRDAWSIWSKLAASFDIEDDRWHEAANCNLLGDLLGATGRGDEAAETYRRALSIWERLATETRDPDRRNHLCWTRTALARLFRSQGKTDAADAVFRDAEAACREAAAMQPTAAEPQLLLGDLLQSQDKFSEAKGAYTEAIRLKPEWPELWAARAECQRRDGKSADVVDDYSRAIALKPDRQWYWHERADAYACLGKWTDALPDHCRAIELGDNDAGERRRRGDCYRALGQFKDAEADYSRAIELDPADGEQWYDRWAIRNQMGETDLAKADLKQAQAWCISAGAEQQNMLAWYLVTSTDLQVRDAPLAVRLAKAAVIARSDWGEAWNTLGVAQYRSGDWAGAIESLNRSMSLRKGGSAEDWYFLAMASHQLGQQTEAAAWYRRAVRSAQVPSGEMRVFKAEADALMPPSVTGQPVTQTPAATQLAH